MPDKNSNDCLVLIKDDILSKVEKFLRNIQFRTFRIGNADTGGYKEVTEGKSFQQASGSLITRYSRGQSI